VCDELSVILGGRSLSFTRLSRGPWRPSTSFGESMTSFACWLVVVDNVFRDVATAWALSMSNYGGGRLVLALDEDVEDVEDVFSKPFVGTHSMAVVDAALDRQGSKTRSTSVPISRPASRIWCSALAGGCAACSVEPSTAGWPERLLSRPLTVEFM
jgi:hypothetical protein